MKIEWIDFAQRRKLNLVNFVESMTYTEYSQWCADRSVIPVDESSYTRKKKPSVVKQTKSYTKKELNKLLKADVTNVAMDLSIPLNGDETKKQLISLILGLNNS